MELENGIQGLLQGDRYLFDDHRVAKSAKSKTSVYRITNVATGAIRGKKLGMIFDDDTPYYNIKVEA
jgi:hypothetical protein